MAKLGAYYGLCPLIDHRSLLGITQDAENGIVIVTLGKNIAIKFKLSDQKQLCSWRTKDKFSSPIIYDKPQSQYLAVFNDTFIRIWNEEEEFLDKLKKLKFHQQIHTVFLCGDRSFIVFKNGAVHPLKEAIEKRKQLGFEDVINVESDYIVDVLYTNFNGFIFVGFIVNSKDTFYLHWTKFNESNQQDKFYKIQLKRNKVELKGYVFHVDRNSVNFLTLWSDSRIYSTQLQEDVTRFGELFTVIESISCKHYVSMMSLDQNYISLYGCDANEEGALLIIYNVQFKVTQTRQPFKLFTNGAKLFSVSGNLLFPVGQNLAVIPFHLDTEQLAALVGSHKVETNPDPDIAVVHKVQFANWEKKQENITKFPELIKSKIEEFMKQGLSKNTMFETIFENIKNVGALKQLIEYFSDIPESCLVRVIKTILNLQSDKFKKKTRCNFENLQPLERAEMLDIVFTKSFNETLLLTHLRSVLTVDEVLVLLEYINFLFSDDGHTLSLHNFIESEAKLIEWSCVLLDSNYQKFLFSKDEKTKEILIGLKKQMEEALEMAEDAHLVAALLRETQRREAEDETVRLPITSNYSIEDFPFY